MVTLVAFAVALLMAEGVARLLTRGERPTQFGCYYLPNGTPLSNKQWVETFLTDHPPVPGVRHGFRPNGTWKFCYPMARHAYFAPGGCVFYSTGPHGYRGPEGLWHKPPGRLRVLVIGDSVSFGVGVPAESLYSRHLERLLRRKRPQLDVVNMGVLGYMASEGVAVLLHQGLQRDPDLVIWQLHINDLIAMEGWAPEPVALPLPESWRRKLKLVSLIEHRVAVTRHVAELERKYGAKADPLVMDERTEDFIRAADWLGVALRQLHLPCVAMLYPYPDYLRTRYPFLGLHRLFQRYCTKVGILPLDLLPWLKRIPPRDLWVDQSDNHPTPLGHRVMAQALLSTLEHHFGPGLERLGTRDGHTG